MNRKPINVRRCLLWSLGYGILSTFVVIVGAVVLTHTHSEPIDWLLVLFAPVWTFITLNFYLASIAVDAIYMILLVQFLTGFIEYILVARLWGWLKSKNILPVQSHGE
ncbi:MAG: hypothetical protein LBU53_05945 [Zoogloeaceae bacterium]|jgi:hypothetical protein|nr:hypothetical protein [Zoogloeaceae bacterium]